MKALVISFFMCCKVILRTDKYMPWRIDDDDMPLSHSFAFSVNKFFSFYHKLSCIFFFVLCCFVYLSYSGSVKEEQKRMKKKKRKYLEPPVKYDLLFTKLKYTLFVRKVKRIPLSWSFFQLRRIVFDFEKSLSLWIVLYLEFLAHFFFFFIWWLWWILWNKQKTKKNWWFGRTFLFAFATSDL